MAPLEVWDRRNKNAALLGFEVLGSAPMPAFIGYGQTPGAGTPKPDKTEVNKRDRNACGVSRTGSADKVTIKFSVKR